MKAVLTYHSIDDTGSPISVSPGIFTAHLRWLSSGRVRALSLDDVQSHPHDGDDAVSVTFDDGFLNAQGAMEALQMAGVPVTVFVVSGHVGGTNAWGGTSQRGIPTLPLLGWGDLERLRERGVQIQAHTRTHPRLTRLPDSALDDELAGAREDLRARLDVRSTHLAYPYGDVNAAVADRAAGSYQFAHTTEFRTLAPGDRPMYMPRLDMYYFRSPGALEAWGRPAFRRRLVWIRARRAIRARLRPSGHATDRR